MRLLFALFFSILLFHSCQLGSSNIPEIKREVFLSTPLDSLYQDLRPEIQQFSIDNNLPQKVKAKNGTEVFIPENSFVDHLGNPIEGNVEVEITEVFALEDFISSGLITMSNGQLLISNGMINIDAKANGVSLQVKDGKALSVNMPTFKNAEGFQMFTGNGQNWEVDSSMLEGEYLIPVPLELLYFNGNTELLNYYHYGHEDNRIIIFEENNISITNSKYENTLIATEEFKERLPWLWSMSYETSRLENQGYFLHKKPYDKRTCNLSIWKKYYDNLDKPIEELDEMVTEKYISYIENHYEELIQLNKEVNAYNDSINSLYRNNYRAYFLPTHKDSILNDAISDIKNFPTSGKGKIKTINDYDVNLNAEDAFTQLENKGVAANEISEILNYHFKRKAIIDRLEKRKKFFEEQEARREQITKNRKAITEFYETTSFSVKKLGWINCDRFYDSPSAKEAQILAKNTSSTSLDFIDFSLVIPEMNARLQATPNENGEYTFTGDAAPYTKLPIGKEAIITAISFQNDSVFYASQKIKIAEELLVNLNMEVTTKAGLKDALGELF